LVNLEPEELFKSVGCELRSGNYHPPEQKQGITIVKKLTKCGDDNDQKNVKKLTQRLRDVANSGGDPVQNMLGAVQNLGGLDGLAARSDSVLAVCNSDGVLGPLKRLIFPLSFELVFDVEVMSLQFHDALLLGGGGLSQVMYLTLLENAKDRENCDAHLIPETVHG
jgi:hypothetical protein